MAKAGQIVSGSKKMQGKNPEFSIIMANYNNGQFITAAVNSVMAQTHSDWELIIVDDCSTDESVAVIKSLAVHDRRIRILQNERNFGVGFTKRRAIENCRAEVVGILDPDDLIAENALKVMLASHNENPSAAICWSEYYLCDEVLNVIEESRALFKGDAKMGYLLARPGDIHHFWTFKREAYLQTDGIADSLRLAEDQDLFYKLEEVGSTQHVDQVLYYYRHHQGSTSIGSNTAKASAFHLLVMYAALKRRENMLPKAIWLQQRHKVCEYYEQFLEWGAPKLELGLAARLQHTFSDVHKISLAKSPLAKAIRFRLNKFKAGIKASS
jgi:glycosyltransferase involved in cell wall biosynthesis